MTTTAQDYQDILDLESALLRWCASQDPEPKHVAFCMVRIAGALAGRLAKDNDLELKEGVNLLCKILRERAKMAYEADIK